MYLSLLDAASEWSYDSWLMWVLQEQIKVLLISFDVFWWIISFFCFCKKEHYIDKYLTWCLYRNLPKSHSRYQKYDSVFDVLWLPIYYCSEILQYYNAMNRFWQKCIGLAADSNASQLRYHLCFCKFRPILKFIRKAIPSMNVCVP